MSGLSRLVALNSSTGAWRCGTRRWEACTPARVSRQPAQRQNRELREQEKHLDLKWSWTDSFQAHLPKEQRVVCGGGGHAKVSSFQERRWVSEGWRAELHAAPSAGLAAFLPLIALALPPQAPSRSGRAFKELGRQKCRSALLTFTASPESVTRHAVCFACRKQRNVEDAGQHVAPCL